jgi:hypothetical protein
MPQFPKTKEQLKREKERIDFKKELIEQNLKRALTPPAKEDEYQEKVLEKFSKFINQKLGDIKKVQIEELLFGDTEEINNNQDF